MIHPTKTLLATAILAVSASVTAQTYNGYTLNPDTNIITGGGLEWLRWTETTQISVNQALERYPGWRLASNSEMADLFNAFVPNNLFINAEDYRNQVAIPYDDEENTYSRIFIEIFGATGEVTNEDDIELDMDPNNYQIYSTARFGSDEDEDGLIRIAEIEDDYTMLGRHYDGSASFSRDIYNLQNASWMETGVALVREPQDNNSPAWGDGPLTIYPYQKIVSDAPEEYGNYGTAVDVYRNRMVIADGAYGGPIDYFVIGRDGYWVKKSEISEDDRLSERPVRNIAMAGRYTIAGTPEAYSNLGEANLYYREDGGNWSPVLTLDSVRDWGPDSQFGGSVGISGDSVIVSAPTGNSLGYWHSGSVYFYDKTGDTWNLTNRINQGDEGYTENLFGWSVDILNPFAIVTARGVGEEREPGTRYGVGGTYFFKKDNDGQWVKTQLIEPQDHTPADSYGATAALGGGFAAVSAPTTDVEGLAQVGKVHIYRRKNTGEWIEHQVLTPPDLEENRRFGETIAMNYDTLVIGSPGSGADDGVIYVYKLDENNQWQHTANLALIDGSYDTGYGGIGGSVNVRGVQSSSSLAFDFYGNVIVGAPRYDYFNNNSEVVPWAGAVFIYDLNVLN